MALLQRTPVLRVAGAVAEAIASAPIASVIRSAVGAAATLGAIDTLAGASTGPAVSQIQLISNTPQPATATVGQAFSEQVSFYSSSVTIVAQSWTVDNALPPGMTVVGGTVKGGQIVVNTPNGILTLSGTPTKAGTYSFNITGYQYTNQTPPSTSATATITVSAPVATAPVFTTAPASQSVAAGGSVSFNVAVSGSPTPTLQWDKDGQAIAGATGTTLALSNIQSTDGGNYTVVATNSAGTVTSQPATLTVTSATTAPSISTDPIPQTVLVGDTVTLSVAAAGAPTPAIRWQKDGAALTDGGNITGAGTATLTIAGATAADAGSYAAVATNSLGTVTSKAVLVTVNPAPLSASAAWLTNISVRTTIVAGQSPLIVGLTVSGGSKPILVRAAGPALGAFGLTNVMADPQIQLYAAGASVPLLTNDNWDSSLAPTFQALGAFPFPVGSKDAAFVQPLGGGYTVEVPATGPGTMMIEAYDTNPSINSPRLVNISARNQVGTGADVLIAGFTISGSGTKRLLIRAVGPKLADFGVGGVLADPKLSVYSGQTEVAENDNWDASLATTFNAVGAFPLTPGSKDAAMVVPLAAGQSYTVEASGADGSTGQAMIEVYEVP